MQESVRTQKETDPMPIRREAADYALGRAHTANPYSGRVLPVSGRLALKIRDSFGIDAASVSLRESAEVAEMGARATAQGNVIRFAPGEYRPDTREGMEVLGHELSHVAEQARGDVSGEGGRLLVSPAHEAGSDAAGAAFAGGSLSAAESVSPVSAQSAPVQGLFGNKRKQDKNFVYYYIYQHDRDVGQHHGRHSPQFNEYYNDHLKGRRREEREQKQSAESQEFRHDVLSRQYNEAYYEERPEERDQRTDYRMAKNGVEVTMDDLWRERKNPSSDKNAGGNALANSHAGENDQKEFKGGNDLSWMEEEAPKKDKKWYQFWK